MLMNVSRFKNRLIAKIITRFPSLSRSLIEAYKPWESEGIPWTPVIKPLRECKLALVTTAGVHHKRQQPFNMSDANGDPTFRIIDATTPLTDLMITHDYYDHSDADRDINIVFPVDRLREFKEEGLIGDTADIHYSFMGHIIGPHIPELMSRTAVEVAKKLKSDKIDAVLLTPG